MAELEKIGFGGGCHWCTEAVFQAVVGAEKVEQGWIATACELERFSEAVLVYYNPTLVSLPTLVAIHLSSHSSTAMYSMRVKYRSAVYVLDDEKAQQVSKSILLVQQELGQAVVTEVLRLGEFKLNSPEFLDYYATDPNRPFCKTYIEPKLKRLIARFGDQMKIASGEFK